MKKRIVMVLALCVMLCACNTPGATETNAQQPQTAETPVPTAEPIEEEEVVSLVEVQAPASDATDAPTMPPTPIPTPSPEPTPEPTPTPSGLLGGRFPDKFSDEPILEERSYKSRSISISITSHTETNKKNLTTTYHVADIYVQDVTLIQTAAAENDFTMKYAHPVEQIASRVGALLAIDGDTYSHMSNSIVLRNGELYRNKLENGADLCVLYRDGRMETKKWGTFTLEEIVESDPWQVWSFGPALLDENGKAMTDITYKRLARENPRAAIGYYEPGHYCFVIVEGRLKGMTDGLTFDQLSALMEELGCKVAYNLDGGGSAQMYWVNGIMSKSSNSNRWVSDIIYILPEGPLPPMTTAQPQG